MVKNEADIIESFVRHNLKRLDALIIIDDGSTDGTKEILFALESEGLNLISLEWDGTGFEQSRKLSELLLVTGSRGTFDWILPLDADEAIDCESRLSLEATFKQVKNGRIARLPWRTYVPTAEDDWSERNPFLRINNRRKEEAPQFYKIAIPSNQLTFMPIVIASGSHSARRAGSFKQLPMTTLADVALAHFPVRSPVQLVSKVVCGWLSICAEGSGRPSRGFHWRDMYAQFMRNGIPTKEEIEQLARSYSGQKDDGVTICSSLRTGDPAPLRYGKVDDSAMFVSIARTAERLIYSTKGAAKGHESADQFCCRTSWRHHAMPHGGWRAGQEKAVLAYLERRVGAHIEFVDDRSAHLLPGVFDRVGVALTNLQSSIVSMGAANYRRLFASALWREKGWVVDDTATLAVRLLARSIQMRRYAVVFVRRNQDREQPPFGESVSVRSQPGWWETVRLAILRCHFAFVRCYWRFRSIVSIAYQTEVLSGTRAGRRAGDARVANMN